MRKLLIALFATAALPGVALAQEDQRPNRADWGARARQASRAEAGQTSEERAAPAREFRRDRTESPAPTAQAQVQVERNRDRSDWSGGRGNADAARGRRFDTPTPAAQPPLFQQPAQRSDADASRRSFDRNAARRDVNGNANDGRRDYDRNAGDRGRFDRNDDGRRDAARNDNRRDWNDRNDDRRDANDNRNDNRNWNGRNDNDRRGWDNNRNAGNARNWDRNWRSNQRYDWQRYRGANRYAFRLPRYAEPYGWHYGYRRFSVGAYLFAGLFSQDYWIGNPWEYRLPPVSWPYQWVRYYNDALLVDTRSGYVVDSIQDIFWY